MYVIWIAVPRVWRRRNPELRKRFKGKPEYVVSFMRFVAQELREIMAEMGFRTVNEMIGRVDRLKKSENLKNWKHEQIDLSPDAVRAGEFS